MRRAMILAAGFAAAAPLAAGAPDPSHALYRAQLGAAESALRLGEDAVAREWLDAVAPAARGFEWRVFDAQLDQSVAVHRMPAGHATALAVSSDGARLACGLSDGSFEVRDAATGNVVRRVERAHAEALTDIRFDDAGARLVTTSRDRKARTWDAATGKQIAEFGGHNFPIGGAVFTRDGGTVISVGYERPPGTVAGTVRVWNAADGTLLRTLEGGRKPLVDVALSPDGSKVVAASWDFCVFVWDLARGGEPVKLAVPDEGRYNAVDGVAFSPDGTRIAAASRDATVRVWDAVGGALVASLRGHTDGVAKLAFAPDGRTLVTASADGTLRFWNTADWSLAALARGHGDDVVEIAVSPRGDRAFSASLDGTVRSWDLRPVLYGDMTLKAEAAQYAVRFSPDDGRVASCGYDGKAQVWSAVSGRLLARWQAHPAESSCHMLDWPADGRWIATGSYDRTVRLWDAVTRAEIARFDHDDPLNFLRASADGRRVASAGGQRVYVWDVAGRGRLTRFERHAASVTSVSLSRDGTLCASVDRAGKALIWDAATGAVRTTIAADEQDLTDAVFSSDETELIVSGRSGNVVRYSIADGHRAGDVARLRHAPERLALSPDGTRLAAAAQATSVLDLARGGLLATFRSQREAVYGIAFDATGTRLASASADGTVTIASSVPLRERVVRQAEHEAARVRLTAADPGGRTLSAVERAAWTELLTEGAKPSE